MPELGERTDRYGEEAAPDTVIATGAVDYILPVEEIAATIVRV